MPVASHTGGFSGAQIATVTVDSAVAVGSPVYILASGNGELAEATTRVTARVAGLSAIAALAGSSVRIVLRGSIYRSDWTPITGTLLLIPGNVYWLDVVAGKLASVAPSYSGAIVARVGRALSTTTMDVQTEQQTVRL